MQCAVARRLMAMLLTYPLLMTAAAFDISWALLLEGRTAPVVYSASVVVIATALALSTHLVRRVSAAAQILTVIVSLALTNAIVVVAATELARSGRPARDLLPIAGPAFAVPLALAAAIAVLAEQVARRLQRPSPSIAASRPLPTLVDLVGPTLVDEFEAPTVAERPAVMAS